MYPKYSWIAPVVRMPNRMSTLDLVRVASTAANRTAPEM